MAQLGRHEPVRDVARLTSVLAMLWLGGCSRERSFAIPSDGMAPTILIGDRVAVRALAEGEPRRGDIIVYENAPAPSPLLEPDSRPDPFLGEDYIHRVVAVAGDRVRLLATGLMLNGEPVESGRAYGECVVHFGGTDRSAGSKCGCERATEVFGARRWSVQYLGRDCATGAMEPEWPAESSRARPYLGARARNPDWPDVVVPAGNVLVMGDNRNASKDGRFTGFVAVERVRGKAVRVRWNEDDESREDIPLDASASP